jgi:hypothetical protein
MGLIGVPSPVLVRAGTCGPCTPVIVFSGGGCGGAAAEVRGAGSGSRCAVQAPSDVEEPRTEPT